MFFRHSIFYFLAKGVPSLIAFLSVAIFTRLMDPQEFGIYALGYTSALLVSSIFFQWLRIGLLRFYQECGKEQRTTLISTIVAAFCLVALILLTTSALIYFINQDVLLVIIVMLALVQSIFDILLERLRSEFTPVKFGMLAFVRSALMLLGGVIGLRLAGIIGLFTGLITGVAIVVTFELYALAPHIRLGRADRAMVLRLLYFGLPLTATFAFASIMGFADRYMLAWLVGISSSGQYSAAYDLTQKVVVTLMMIINLAGYPLLLKAQAQGDTDGLHKLMGYTLNGLILVSLPVVSAFIVVPSAIADVLLGVDFRQSSIILLPWLGFAALIEGLTVYYFNLSFQLKQSTYHQIWIVALAAVLNVLLNFWLIPHFYELGAAWATLIANFFALSLSFVISREQIRLPLFTLDSLRIVLSALLLCACLAALFPALDIVIASHYVRLALLVVFGGVIYIGMNLILDTMGFRSHARSELTSPFRRLKG